MDLMASLWNSDWSSELVVNVVKSEDELALIKEHGIVIHRLKRIISSLAKDKFVIGRASGADIVDLVLMRSRGED